MRRIKNYEDFINEEINWRKGLAGAAIAASLNLTSCDTPKDIENKIPQVEILVKNQMNRINDYQEEGDTVILNNTEVRGPFNIEKLYNQDGKLIEDPNNTYYIVSDISTINASSKKNSYYIMVYLENKETKDGQIIATKEVLTKKELEYTIEYFKKYNKWPEISTNEEINWKNLLSGALIVGSLNLSSCSNKQELEQKKPQIENLVENELSNLNKNFPLSNQFTFHEIDTIYGPIIEKEWKWKPGTEPSKSPEINQKWIQGGDFVKEYAKENTYFTGKELNTYFIISDVRGIPPGQEKEERIWLITSYVEKDGEKSQVYTSSTLSYEEAVSYIEDVKRNGSIYSSPAGR